jgi:hypothetical protein
MNPMTNMHRLANTRYPEQPASLYYTQFRQNDQHDLDTRPHEEPGPHALTQHVPLRPIEGATSPDVRTQCLPRQSERGYLFAGLSARRC